MTMLIFLGAVGDILIIPLLYFKLWQFTIPSILITGLLFRGIAAMVFFQRKLANPIK